MNRCEVCERDKNWTSNSFTRPCICKLPAHAAVLCFRRSEWADAFRVAGQLARDKKTRFAVRWGRGIGWEGWVVWEVAR